MSVVIFIGKREMIGREDKPLWCFLSPKTKRSARSVVMSPALKEILEIHRMTALVGVEDLVFCNKAGNPIDPNNFIQRNSLSF